MFERPKGGQRAVLVHLELPGADFESDRQEFIDLARSAGAEVTSVIGGRRDAPDAGLFVGSGKAQEVADAAVSGRAELAIFNHDLSPSQERNLEKLLKCRVLDRAGLILDIFAKRARSHEGKLQVELAQLQHLSTRLIRGWTHLERQRGGGIGLTGPGETQLELDRRLIRGRIGKLKRDIEQVRSRRAQNRQARTRNAIPTVALAGYTNAGKSTLFNALTGEQTFVSSQLFATLDPTLRRLELPSGGFALLADTVGFIHDLPHDLVAAFRATLEESREADLLLHVVDAADPERSLRIAQVEAVLEEIGAQDVPRLQVFNKIDLSENKRPRQQRDARGLINRIHVSAIKSTGLDALRAAIAARLFPDLREQTLRLSPSLPQTAKLRARLFAEGAVRRERILKNGTIHLRVMLPAEKLRRLRAESGFEPSQAL